MIWKCMQCRKPFECEAVELFGLTITPTICNGCDDENTLRAQRAQADAREKARQDAFTNLCPATYRDTDISRLPNVAKSNAVLSWVYGPRGLIVSGKPQKKGEPRQGKTRSVWLLIKRLIILEGRSVVAMGAGELARAIGEAYGTSGEMGAELFDRLTSTDVLFIDDFGKFKVTPRVEDELLGLIEHRTAHQKPILMTTNSDRKQLAAAFSADRAEPMFDRLREFCRGINFDLKK